MIDIEEFGIHEGISEVIFTTISPSGFPNAAPIGLHMKNNRLFANLYNSKTLDNILGMGRACANIVDKPIPFVRSALSDIEYEAFEFIEGFPVLRDSLGWIMFDCIWKKGESVSVVELTPVNSNISRRTIKPVNRGFNAVIEAAIHATRYAALKDRKYIDYIDYYNGIVQKCGGRSEKDAMKLIYDLLCKEQ